LSYWIYGAIALVVLGALGALVSRGWQSSDSASPPGASDKTEHPKATVSMSAAKISAAGIRTAIVATQPVHRTATIPGRVQHDARRRLAITAPVDCVVERVQVQPGDEVEAGAPLVVLSSPEVGLARDEVGRARDVEKVAQRESDNAEQILANAKDLLAFVENSPTAAEVLKQFAGKKLGEHREHVVSAYSKWLAAQAANEETSGIGNTGAVSRRLVQQRQSEAEVARAGFEAQRETTVFECLQARDKAAAELAHAQRLLNVAEGRLRTLLGSHRVREPGEGEPLSDFTLLAAQAGRVEDHVAVAHQRLKAGEELLTLSDTSVLWVSASVHEQQWQATTLVAGDEVQVRFPALGGDPLPARVRFVGTEISQETRSLPLVAEIENDRGRLRPGMFAWVSVPVSEEREAVVVPAGAIVRHEDQPFVFVEESPGTFRRVDVKLGEEDAAGTEVVAGLKGGERVVTSGVFVLKSELLLEHEED
jgi:RND family efflux transporter MFP subunit